MSYTLAISPIATFEIQAAAAYYNGQKLGLGHEFAVAVYETIDRIVGNPLAYAIEHNHIRAALTRRIPYVICFRIYRDHIVVLGVVQGASDLAAWRSRS